MTLPTSILVVGSVNMDLVVRAAEMPQGGQTVLGEGFVTASGGKGANQAVAVARQGCKCVFLGRVGNDAFGRTLTENMKAEGIDCHCLLTTDDAPTGVAMIIVDAKGENSIVVASGANFRVTPDDVYHNEHLFKQASVVLLQLELPLPTVVAARVLAAKHKCKVVLDPAPAVRTLPPELCDVDVLTPNSGEAQTITGESIVPQQEERSDKLLAAELLRRGAKAAVLKLGARGCLVMTAEGEINRHGPYKVEIVDTTAAGDAFTASLAAGMARGLDLVEAARFANAAGALACTRLGAQGSMPTMQEIQNLMAKQK
jgi:ribokinase